MKKIVFTLSLTLLALVVGCDDFSKKDAQKEISIEKKKINDTLVKATITTSYKQGEKVSEEIQIIEGSAEEVNEKIKHYKKEILIQKDHGQQSGDQMTQRTKTYKINLSPKSETSTHGEVTLTEENGKVTLEAHISELSQGIHAIHIHEKADCSSSDGKSTGGHWNPTFESHGAWGDQNGFHRGDIGNFSADESGHGMIIFSTDLWCLGCEDETKNLMGKAIIVHQGEDDLTSQPSGAAGKRISCAGIIE